MKAIKEDEIETEIMKSCDFTEETEEVLVIIDKFLKGNTQRSCTTEGPKLMNPSHSPSTGVSDNSKNKIKLPKLETKYFQETLQNGLPFGIHFNQLSTQMNNSLTRKSSS